MKPFAMPISAAVAEQNERENVAIAHGLKRQDPAVLDRLTQPW